jgi:hypothetical protein
MHLRSNSDPIALVTRNWDGAANWAFPALDTGRELTASGANQLLEGLEKRAGLTGRSDPHSLGIGSPKTT